MSSKKPESLDPEAARSLLAELLLALDPADADATEFAEAVSRIRRLLASGALDGALDDSFVLFVEDISFLDMPLTEETHWTPLTWAARQGLAEVARPLLAAGADPNQINADQEFPGTPLTWAAERGHLEIVDQLLAAGVDPGPVKELRTSPLHAAAEHGHMAIVKRLLAAGADPLALDFQKRTPAQAAGGRQWAKIRTLLRAAEPPRDDSGSAIRLSRHKRKIDPSREVGSRDFLELAGGGDDWYLFGVEADFGVVSDACAELFQPRRRYPGVAHRSVPELDDLIVLLRLRSTSWILGRYDTVDDDSREWLAAEDKVIELSRRFDTRTFSFQSYDTSGVMVYALYASGECVERASSYEYRVVNRTGEVDRPVDRDPGRDSDLFFSHHGILVPPFLPSIYGPKTFLQLLRLKASDLERADFFDLNRE